MTTPHDPLQTSGSDYPPDTFVPIEDPSTTSPTGNPADLSGEDTDKPGSVSSSNTSTTDTAKEQAANIKDSTSDSAAQVAGTTKEQAQQVTEDVRQQAKVLVDETRIQLSDQADSQRERAVATLRSLGDELGSMSQSSAESGLGAQLAREGSQLTHKVAGFLDERDPGELVEELRELARRRPGTFLLGAALTGVVVGRLTRGVISARNNESSAAESDATSSSYAELPTSPAVPAATPDAPYEGEPVSGYSGISGVPR